MFNVLYLTSLFDNFGIYLLVLYPSDISDGYKTMIWSICFLDVQPKQIIVYLTSHSFFGVEIVLNFSTGEKEEDQQHNRK